METAKLRQELNELDGAATKVSVPFQAGELVFRRWAGPANSQTLLLVHGGSGSWLHWARNITNLQRSFNLVAVDLPGLGDSTALPEGYSAQDAVDIFVSCTRSLMSGQRFHIVAFSWGCAVSAQAAGQLEPQLRSLMLTGPASLGDIPRRGSMQPLIKRTPDMSEHEIFSTNRENLARLMIQDRSRIDDLAVLIQTMNTQKARFNSPQFARTTLVLDGVQNTSVPLKVVYGEFDAPALPDIPGKEALFKAANASCEFEVIDDAGHWLQYEKPELFNKLVCEWIKRCA